MPRRHLVAIKSRLIKILVGIWKPTADDRSIARINERPTSVPFHKLRLLEMVKVIHLTQIAPSYHEWNRRKSTRRTNCILGRLQPPRNLVPNAVRMTFDPWRGYYFSLRGLNNVSVTGDLYSKSYLSTKEACHCSPPPWGFPWGFHRWPPKTLRYNNIVHNIHCVQDLQSHSCTQLKWPYLIVPGAYNIVWIETRLDEVSWDRRDILECNVDSMRDLKEASGRWRTNKVTANVIIQSPSTLQEARQDQVREMNKGIMDTCLKDVLVHITFKDRKPGQTCGGCHSLETFPWRSKTVSPGEAAPGL